MSRIVLLLCFFIFSVVLATVHYEEEFNNDPFKAGSWVASSWKESSGAQGTFEHGLPEFFGDESINKGLLAKESHRFYTASSKFAKSFSNKGKDLVIQYEVKLEKGPGCGGAYIKVLPGTLDQKNFDGDTKYNIMFGPDYCGYAIKKVHVIFNYNDKNFLIKKEPKPQEDKLSHVYTLVVRPDNTYEVLIDLQSVQTGSLPEDWDFLGPKVIPDPLASKPKDWVDEPQIDDATDSKPADWDQPRSITDPEAKKPEGWDDELDGEWEAPQIDNPEYKGEWKARKVPNPAFKGPWVHPQVPNPDYKEDPNIYAYEDNGAVGIEIWQVEAGLFFDNIFVGDSLEEAKAFAEKTWGKTHEAEKEKFTASEEKKKAEEEERRKAEAEEAAKKAEAHSTEKHDEFHLEGKDEL